MDTERLSMISGQTVCKGSDVKSRRGITLRQFWLENNLDHLKCVENNEKTCRWGSLLQIYSYRKLHNGDNSWEKKPSGDVWKCIHTSPDGLRFGSWFLIAFHGFIDCSIDKGSGTFTHLFCVVLNDGTLLWGDTNLDFNEMIIIFFVSPSTSFG